MKLLSAKEVKQKKQTQATGELLRAKKVHDYVQQGNKELNELKDNREARKQIIESEYQEFSKDIQLKRDELTNEVDILEERKKEALKPITDLEDKAQENMDIAFEAVEKSKEQKLELERRENSIAQSEGFIKRFITDTEKEFDEKTRVILIEKKSTKEQTRALKKKEDTFAKKVKKQAGKITEDRLKIEHAEKLLTARESELNQKEKYQTEEKERLRLEDIAVRDKYKALEQAKIHLGIK